MSLRNQIHLIRLVLLIEKFFINVFLNNPSYVPLIFFCAQIILKVAFCIASKSKDLSESRISTIKYIQVPEKYNLLLEQFNQSADCYSQKCFSVT